MKWPLHGSNPQYIYEATNIPQPETIIDFSANINPLGPPSFLQKEWDRLFEKITDYPDPYASSLKKAINEKENISHESILIGNGGAELITLIGRMLAGKNVLIVQPTFSEYETVCRANNCYIHYHYIGTDWELNMESLVVKLDGIDAVFICNPNNPLGICFSKETIIELAYVCQKRGINLIVDEAFYDFWKNYESLVPIIKQYKNVILLRSLTKMFAIPGLRLGYALGNVPIIQELSKYQPHWSVNVVAMLAGEQCIKDISFVQESVKFIEKEREKLFTFFKEQNFHFSPSKTNFYVLRDPNLIGQYPLFEYLLKNGIVPRHTMNFPSLEGKWLRFAIKNEEENNKLMKLLKDWRK